MDKILDYMFENKILVALIVGIAGFGVFHMLNSAPTHHADSAIKVENQLDNSDVKEKPIAKKEAKMNPKSEEIVVDIQGAIKAPGVYRFKANAIVQDAIGKAGGLTDVADVRLINQAQRLTDQMQIVVPKIGETANTTVTPNMSGPNTGSDNTKVNINTATVDDFQKVSGIGPKKAEKIIDYRTQNGNFANVEDLTKVSGIGDKTLESLRDQLTV